VLSAQKINKNKKQGIGTTKCCELAKAIINYYGSPNLNDKIQPLPAIPGSGCHSLPEFNPRIGE
jgi:hypothetical protein